MDSSNMRAVAETQLRDRETDGDIKRAPITREHTRELQHIIAHHYRSRLRRSMVSTVIFLLLAAVAYLILLGQGAVRLSPVEVLDVLTGGGSRRAINVVWDLRLPVAIATVLVGAALGVAGSWTQTMARNPLASPDILGVSGGAAVAVVAGTVLIRPEWSQEISTYWWRCVLALIGATVVVVVLVLLGGVGTSSRVVVVGLALSFLTQSLVHYFLLKADIRRAADAQTWLAGSTGFVRTEALFPLIGGLLPFLVFGLLVARNLPLLAHDDATAAALGVDIRRTRLWLLIASTGIVATVVAMVGPIGFVALLAPQLAKLVAASPNPQPLGAAAAGAALLSVCAVLAGALPMQAPVGLVTAIIGGPALVVLVTSAIRRNQMKG